MSKYNKVNLSDAMLQRGKSPSPVGAGNNVSPLVPPVSEMAMMLTLDQVKPNPDNPRKSRNPRYDDIKASIRARGLDSIPKVTRDPEGEDVYIFSDGGNTRYQILSELWQETGEDRFYRIQTIVKPWPGRLKCLIGHLAENEVRGDLTYIDKALGIRNARTIQEEQLGKSVALRELSDLLNQEGYPIHYSSISRMEDTLKYLYPNMPDLLDSGLSRGQVVSILTLRSAAEKTWSQYEIVRDESPDFGGVFGATCSAFNNPDSYSFEMFRDELIGQLLKALPHPSLNYDRWLIELDPKEQQRREMFGEPPAPPVVTPVKATLSSLSPGTEETRLPPQPDDKVHITGLRSGTLTGAGNRPEPVPDNNAEVDVPTLPAALQSLTDGSQVRPANRTETQPDLYGGPAVFSGESGVQSALNDINLFSALSDPLDESGRQPSSYVSSVAFAATGLEPVTDIWHIPALQDDIEHLQDMAYRLAFELAEAMGCEDSIHEDKAPQAAGYNASAQSSNEFVLFLAGMTGNLPKQPFNMFMFCLNFFGSHVISDQPVFADEHVVKVMRLIRVLRRLRELQRDAAKGGSDEL
ncbi:ParB family protein [Rahnella sp. BCC 1045]|uniref:ParB family protein n=1 Tax=Rahnella sp. BCC 1045 TaxID=2816251 RepID=UPI001C264C9E|nr:ParB family protein [Rahnella sp. BCC 1045]MBU9819852.1 ParB family protein [Rahnella sp. BCC 1045]